MGNYYDFRDTVVDLVEEQRLQELKALREKDFKAHTNIILTNLKRDRTGTKKGKNDNKEVEKNTNLPSNTSPIVDFLAKEKEKEKKQKDEPKENQPVKQKFQIPSFFLKKQEEAKKQIEDITESQDRVENPELEGLPQIPLPN